MKRNQSPGLVHKVYGSDANGVPLGFINSKHRLQRGLAVEASRSAAEVVPNDGMQSFHFRDSSRRQKSRQNKSGDLFALTVSVNLGVNPEPRFLLVGTEVRHHFHQIPDHLLGFA